MDTPGCGLITDMVTLIITVMEVTGTDTGMVIGTVTGMVPTDIIIHVTTIATIITLTIIMVTGLQEVAQPMVIMLIIQEAKEPLVICTKAFQQQILQKDLIGLRITRFVIAEVQNPRNQFGLLIKIKKCQEVQ